MAVEWPIDNSKNQSNYKATHSFRIEHFTLQNHRVYANNQKLTENKVEVKQKAEECISSMSLRLSLGRDYILKLGSMSIKLQKLDLKSFSHHQQIDCKDVIEI